MIVEFIETKDKMIRYQKNDSYAFRADRPHKWLQRLCCRIMQKLGAYDMGEKVTYTRHTIDPDVFMERIFRQAYHLEAHFNRKPKRILVGAEDFERIMNCSEIRQSFMFNASYNYGREIICGLQVEVIPWMRGILVMP